MNSFSFLKKGWKNCFLALVGITWVKGTSVIEKETKKRGSGYYSFIFLKKLEKLFSGTCRYYVGKRYKCDEK